MNGGENACTMLPLLLQQKRVVVVNNDVRDVVVGGRIIVVVFRPAGRRVRIQSCVAMTPEMLRAQAGRYVPSRPAEIKLFSRYVPKTAIHR